MRWKAASWVDKNHRIGIVWNGFYAFTSEDTLNLYALPGEYLFAGVWLTNYPRLALKLLLARPEEYRKVVLSSETVKPPYVFHVRKPQ